MFQKARETMSMKKEKESKKKNKKSEKIFVIWFWTIVALQIFAWLLPIYNDLIYWIIFFLCISGGSIALHKFTSKK